MLHYYVYFNIDIFLLKGQWGYKYYILYFDVFKKYIIKMFSSSKKMILCHRYRGDCLRERDYL